MILVGILKVQIISQNECVMLHRAGIKWVRERDVLVRLRLRGVQSWRTTVRKLARLCLSACIVNSKGSCCVLQGKLFLMYFWKIRNLFILFYFFSRLSCCHISQSAVKWIKSSPIFCVLDILPSPNFNRVVWG